jgi:iron complex outermembrane receptor protein
VPAGIAPQLVAAFSACLAAAPADAQRAEQNVVTSADDAFGTSVGSQTIGLYSMTDARGFNPLQAGNLRIEGLYFDTPTQYLSPCLVRESTMRIGIAAQSYSFPSPTGIADIKLPVPADKSVVSGYASRGAFAESTALLEGQAPLSQQLFAFACAGIEKNFLRDAARRATNLHGTSVLRWQPTQHFSIVPFVALQVGSDREVVPAVYTDGVLPPPLFDVARLATQPFTSQGWRTTTLGTIVRYVPDAHWNVTLGVFRVIEQDPRTLNDEYLSVLPNRTADHVLDVTPAYNSASTSGELRIARQFGEAGHDRTLELAVRGRRSNRDYGGDVLADYGVIGIDSAPPIAPMPYVTGAISIDETRQLDAGILYEERWRGVGSLAVGLLRSNYQRTITDPGAVPQTDKAGPWLGSVRFAAAPAAGVTVYGSFVQGLEDAALAPITAVNRGQPPAATRTRQTDGGVRWAPTDRLSLVVGAFQIDKAYLNLDVASVYTTLGAVRHRGLETSITYAHEGLKLVAGGVLLRPKVERTVAEAGATGLVPLGPVPLTLTANLDYAPPRWRPWAASLQWNYLSARVVTSDDRFQLPTFTTVSAGMRYESTVGRHPLTVRLDAVNLMDARALRVTALEQLMPDLGRRFTLSIAVDD